jgi:hypothetical protein
MGFPFRGSRPSDADPSGEQPMASVADERRRHLDRHVARPLWRRALGRTAAPDDVRSTTIPRVQLRLLGVAATVVFISACGSDSTGTRPSIAASFPPVGSVAVAPPASEVGALQPETQPPQTQPPQTQPPETPPPETPPVEQIPEQTAPVEPTVPAVVATDPAPPTTEDTDDDGTVWWPWVLGAVVVIGAIVAIARRRPSGPTWTTRSTELLDEIDLLTSHLVAVTPAGLLAVAQGDAMKLATMRATLRDLIEAAPDATSRTVLSGLTMPISDLHGAVDVVALSVEPSPAQTSPTVSQLAAHLHTVSASVRAELALHPG